MATIRSALPAGLTVVLLATACASGHPGGSRPRIVRSPSSSPSRQNLVTKACQQVAAQAPQVQALLRRAATGTLASGERDILRRYGLMLSRWAGTIRNAGPLEYTAPFASVLGDAGTAVTVVAVSPPAAGARFASTAGRDVSTLTGGCRQVLP